MHKTFPRSEHWYIENDIAYFIGLSGGLFQYDFSSEILSVLGELPLKENRRGYSVCVKSGRYIFCFPYAAMDVLIFDIKGKCWSSLKINRSDTIGLGIMAAWQMKECIYSYMIHDNNIMIINPRTMEYKFWENKKYKGNDIYEFILEKDTLYSFPVYSIKNEQKCLHIWNLVKGKKKTIYIPKEMDRLDTVIFDGEMFWISKPGRVYTWRNYENKINKVPDFPEEFQLTYATQSDNGELVASGFSKAILLQGNIWFIPFMNNPILALDLKNKTWYSFRIESSEFMKKIDIVKPNQYIVQYVRDNRYICLWTKASQHCIEIDTKKFTFRTLRYRLKLTKYNENNLILKEHKYFDRIIYDELLSRKNAQQSKSRNIGISIYDKVIGR